MSYFKKSYQVNFHLFHWQIFLLITSKKYLVLIFFYLFLEWPFFQCSPPVFVSLAPQFVSLVCGFDL